MYPTKGNPNADDDNWMATEFIAIRELIGARDDRSVWFCGTPIRRRKGFLLGDPACDRIVFNPKPFETVSETEPKCLAAKFLVAVATASVKLSAGETLVVVLVGHGDDNDHSFTVGDGDGRAGSWNLEGGARRMGAQY
jgi:hypothetical protein